MHATLPTAAGCGDSLTAGLLGEKYIGISVGGEEEVLADGGQISDTQSALVLEDLIGKFLLNSVNKEESK